MSSSFRALCVLGSVALVSAIWVGCGADGSSSATGDDTNEAGGGSGGGGDTTDPDEDAGIVYLDAGLGGGGDDTDGSTTHGGADGGGGGGGGLMCKDTTDVGNTEATAKVLPGITDDDGDAASVSSIIDGTLDVDMFSLAGADTSFHEINATFSTATAEVEVCMFAKCQKGVMDFQGCTGGTQSTNTLGMSGCCISAPGNSVINHNCTGTTDDSVNTFIRVKGLKNACIPYTVNYHF